MEIVNLQNRGGHAKPYQVRQVRRLILKYKPGAEDGCTNTKSSSTGATRTRLSSRRLPSLRRVRTIVVADPPSVPEHRKYETEERFGLLFQTPPA